MKKALKTILIVILCLAAAAGTGYLFFTNLTQSVSAFESVNTFYNSVEQYELQYKINRVLSTGGTRFNQLNSTYSFLKTSMYYTNANLLTLNNTSVGNNVNSKLSTLKSEGSKLANMLDEYAVKCEVAGFDRIAGADDIYVKFSSYLVNFAGFVEYLNSESAKYASTASVDVRFALTDAYLNVIKTSLSNVTPQTTEFPALSYMMNKYHTNNGYIITGNPNGDFAFENNKFIEHYNRCDKQSFAKNLMANLAVAGADSTSNELLATYYMTIIFG